MGWTSGGEPLGPPFVGGLAGHGGGASDVAPGGSCGAGCGHSLIQGRCGASVGAVSLGDGRHQVDRVGVGSPLGQASSGGRGLARPTPGGGINSGMNSGYPSEEQVQADLGDKVVLGLALMVARVRQDLTVYRRTFPAWVADSTDRGLLNWCHDRAWAHITTILDDHPEVHLVDRPPLRELCVGTTYRLRVKKHDIEGKVSTYLTQGALDFLEQEPQTLPGLEEVRLIAGFKWDPELRTVGAAVLSLRDGHDKLVWMHELEEPQEDVGPAPVPIQPPSDPTPPRIGLVADEEREEDGTGTGTVEQE